ncbi:MAG: F0F1 ATP synthase subunit A [Eubacteriales bacterium]|nr:F0F1 ATP synthase subunit A [Eubacteriales bacterium]
MLSVFGLSINIPGEIITIWAITAIIAVLSFIARRSLKERPGRFQNVAESLVEYIENFLTDVLGKEKAGKYYSFLGSLLIFIVVSNYSAFIPGVGIIPGLTVPTSSLSVTVGLGICTFIFLQYYALKMGFVNYIKRFAKPLFLLPLMLLDELVKPVSLSLRLYGNIFGEETVTEQLYEIFPIGIPIIMMLLSLLFCFIQAIVFTMLTSIYIDEATETD